MLVVSDVRNDRRERTLQLFTRSAGPPITIKRIWHEISIYKKNKHVRMKEQRPKVLFFRAFPLETFPNATVARQAQSGRNKTKWRDDTHVPSLD